MAAAMRDIAAVGVGVTRARAERPGHGADRAADDRPRCGAAATAGNPADRGAATGAIVGGSVGAVTGAFSPRPSYAYPYRGYAAHGGCHWIRAHYDRWGEWRPGHCARY